MNNNPEDPRPAVDPNDTVAPKVNFESRTVTDKWWGILYVLSYIGFLSTGFFLVSKSRSRYGLDGDGNRAISDDFLEDAERCCGGAGAGEGPVCYHLDNYYGLDGDGRRRLRAGNSKFDGDEGIFDAFLEAPEIIVGLLALTVGIAVTWVILLRFFAKPIVIIAEACKMAILIVFGIYQEEMSTKVIFFILAGLMVVYVWWAWNKLMFAAKIISHSTIAMKENPSIFTGALFVKLLFAANAALFVFFFAESFNVVEVRDSSDDLGYYYGGDNNLSNAPPYCYFASPRYVGRINIYLSVSYLWTIVMLNHMRLSIVSTIVGSWHFHPENKPGLCVAIKNIGSSFGTICVTSLISTIAEKINRMLTENSFWLWCSPFGCIALPIQLLACCFGAAIKTFVSMLTKFCLILHVFTGDGMVNSAKSVFKILSRHFKGGFITEVTSRGVLGLSSYAFSVGIAMVTWVWIDERFDCNSLNGEDYQWVLYFLVILFNVYFPVLGLYIMILANKWLQDWETSTMEENATNGTTVENYNHLWIPGLAATFVGCIAMMMLTLLSNIFLDIIDTLFLCFAIDRDNNVDMSNDEFTELIKEMPGYAETIISVDTDSDKNNSPEATTPVAVAVPY